MTAPDRLRSAAGVLRERAEAAGCHCGADVCRDGSNWYRPDEMEVRLDGWRSDATFIATMSPPVALAIADWLDVTATHFDREAAFIDESQLRRFEDDWFIDERSIRVADAILGGAS